MDDWALLDPRRYPRLPPARLENARLLTDRFDLLMQLPKGAVFLQIGVADAGFGRHIGDICAPARLIPIGDAAEAAPGQGSIDIAYLDTARDYHTVKSSLVALQPKMRPNGWVILHGYMPLEPGGTGLPCGIIQATHEFIIEADYEIAYLALGPAMICDVALRRIGVMRSIRSVLEENAALRDTIRSLQQSASWRVTTALRALGRIVRPRDESRF